MGRFTYYSPLLAGFALAGLMHDLIWSQVPFKVSEQMHWPIVLLVGLTWALEFQLLMIGAQGLFAQVLPVPGGRSIRGGLATAGGSLICLFFVASIVGQLLVGERAFSISLTLGVTALLSAIGAVVCYVWGWPTAQRDFAD